MSFDFLVIGAGSGGLAAARRAAKHGAKVAIIEGENLGGTCVNSGCIPKKITFNATLHTQYILNSKYYGFQEREQCSSSTIIHNWKEFKHKRDNLISRLHEIYNNSISKEGIELIRGWCKFVSPFTVSIGEKSYSAKHVLIATGSESVLPTFVPGYELGITSNDFFKLSSIPDSIVIVGAGYIGSELSAMLQVLGSKVTMCIRQSTLLTSFDEMIQRELTSSLESTGINIMKHTEVVRVIKEGNNDKKLNVHLADGRIISTDTLLWAIGRKPRLGDLLEKLNMETIKVDEYQNILGLPTGHYALGDVSGKHMLTPVAIAAGRKLADRLFGSQAEAKLDYSIIPSVVFTHPPVGTVGITEQEAIKKHGRENIKIYERKFKNLYYSMIDNSSDANYMMTTYKIVCHGQEEKIIGLHIIGMNSDEILQGFAVAIKMGATRKDFNETIAIHPTASEEIVMLQ